MADSSDHAENDAKNVSFIRFLLKNFICSVILRKFAASIATHMMKKLLSAILLAFAVVSADAQFLFRISGNGLENPSYMLGTIHSLSSSLLDSIPEFLEAEQQCRQMYVEHKPQTTKLVIGQVEQGGRQQRAEYPADKNIFDVIDKESAEILVEKYKEATAIDLHDSKMVYLWKTIPMQFQSQLTLRLSQQLIKNSSMDTELMKKVEARGWDVGQLDDERIMLNQLFDYQPEKPQSIEEQADSLMAFLKDYEGRRQRIVEEYEQTCHYWRTGDYEGFASSHIQEVNQAPRLHRERNEKWLPRMLAAMREKPTMFVFGSAHLIGEHGIIQKLLDAGYKVEQVTSR